VTVKGLLVETRRLVDCATNDHSVNDRAAAPTSIVAPTMGFGMPVDQQEILGGHLGTVGGRTVLAARQGGVAGMADYVVRGKARGGGSSVVVVVGAAQEARSRHELRMQCRGGVERQVLSLERLNGR
jgi:hypothetical protein